MAKLPSIGLIAVPQPSISMARVSGRNTSAGARHRPLVFCDVKVNKDQPAEYATPIPVLSAPAAYPAGACCGPERLATQRPRRCPSASLLQAALGCWQYMRVRVSH